MDIKIERILHMTLDTDKEVQYFKGVLDLAYRRCSDWKETAQDRHFRLDVDGEIFSFEDMISFIQGLDKRIK